LWKKNAPFLYDLIVTHVLDWPTLTCQWFPDIEDQPDKDYNLQRALLGTQTNGEESEYVIIANIKTPKQNKSSDRQDNGENNTSGGYGASEGCRIQISQRINHDGEVNRARYLPQNPDLIGTVSSTGSVNVFDRTKHPNNPSSDGKCNPEIKLEGHTDEPLDLEWNRTNEGQLLTCSKDQTVCLWDIKGYKKDQSSIKPVRRFNFHSGIVGGISWLPQSPSVFGSCSDDKLVAIWDIRKSDPNPVFKTEAHKSEVNVIQFNPFGEFLFATGGNDGIVRLWDLRNINLPLHDLEGHTDSVVSIEWSPINETILATGGNDRRAHIWDISLIGMEQSAEEAEDGAPELMVNLIILIITHNTNIIHSSFTEVTPIQLQIYHGTLINPGL
jgi:histone-binding protein RBBP4